MSINAVMAVARCRKVEHGDEIDLVRRKFEQRREHRHVFILLQFVHP